MFVSSLFLECIFMEAFEYISFGGDLYPQVDSVFLYGEG